MYSMKEACALTGMTYENLKFYCKEGLVPNVKRDSRNYRVFDDHDIKWILLFQSDKLRSLQTFNQNAQQIVW